jgi:uncharacterized membrane protein
MNDPKRLFHLVSYLQYPCMLLGFFYCYKPVVTNFTGFLDNIDVLLVEFNKALVFIGLGTSLSTLQDTTKVQNKFSQRIYDNPRKTKFFLWSMVLQILLFLTLGFVGLFGSNKYLHELAFGLVALGVGFIGMLKAAIEMADYQRKKQLASKD